MITKNLNEDKTCRHDSTAINNYPVVCTHSQPLPTLSNYPIASLN